MGDFSRDTFRLTNVMHQVATAQPVDGARHYVGVRLQQAVPVLDADWNELEDIRRLELELQARHYFGDGIPADSTGFRIEPVSDVNDFAIATGIALVEGRLVFNERAALSYLDQATVFGVTLPALSPPAAPERNDLVYLDVWEEEIGPTGMAENDERLTHPAIGVETCRRIERRWLVRVAEGVIAVADVPHVPGHAYMALARLARASGEALIPGGRIFDLRRTDLNVARYLKVPAHVERGGEVVDSERLALLLDGLRGIYLQRLTTNRFFIDTGNGLGQTLIHFALQHVLQTCTTGALQARTLNLTNTDAMALLASLVTAQRECATTLDAHGLVGVALDQFVVGYGARLDDVDSALGGDLLDGYLAQQAVNAWLAADVNGLPEGNVTVQFLSVSPDEPLESTVTYQVFVRIASGVTSNQTSEIFDVRASLSSATWIPALQTQEVEIDNGGSATLSFSVTVPEEGVVGGTTADLEVVATCRRNPTIQSSQLPLRLEVDERPLAGGVLQYAGPPLGADQRLHVDNALLTSAGITIAFLLNNSSAAGVAYTVEWFVTLEGGAPTTGWAPTSAAPQTNTTAVPGGGQEAVLVPFSGPAGGDVTGTLGALHVQLTQIDGAPAGAEAEEIVVSFVVD